MTYEIPAIPPEITPPPPPPEKRVWGGWATAGFGLLILVIYFAIQVIVIIAGLVPLWVSEAGGVSGLPYDAIITRLMDVLNNHLGLLQSLATIISGIAGFFIIWMFAKARGRAGVGEYLGLAKPRAKSLWLVVAVVGLYFGISILISSFSGGQSGDDIMVKIYKTSVWPGLMWIAVVVFAPLFEEMMFRGFLFEGFRQSRITALAWASLHAVQYGIYTVVAILVLGVAMGYVRLLTKSIWNTLMIHMVINAVGMLGIIGLLGKQFS